MKNNPIIGPSGAGLRKPIGIIFIVGLVLIASIVLVYLMSRSPVHIVVQDRNRVVHADLSRNGANDQYLQQLILKGTPVSVISKKLMGERWAILHIHREFGLRLVDDAVCTGRVNVLKLLLALGAPVDGLLYEYSKPRAIRLRPVGGFCTPLDDAVLGKRLKIARILLDNQASPNRLIPVGPHTYDTAEADAETSGNPELINLFRPMMLPRYILPKQPKKNASPKE